MMLQTMGFMEDLERTREEISSLLQSRLQPMVEPIEDILNVLFILHHFVLDCIIKGLADPLGEQEGGSL